MASIACETPWVLPDQHVLDSSTNLRYLRHDAETKPNPVPFFYQPDPKVPSWIQAKGTKLERRGACQFVIVGKTLDGRHAESRLGAMSIRIRGI
jgi:hypothetical protein